MLRLLLLGRPQIILDGQPVLNFISEKALALFCYLAVRGGSHSRDSLAGLFWGDMPETRARANLRMAFYNLQQLLPGCLKVTRLDASFNQAAGYWLDVEQLASAEIQLKDAAEPSNFLWSALQLYRGSFLEGLDPQGAPEYGEWLLIERERHRRLALSVSQQLADDALQQGDDELVVRALRRTLDIEPWHESAHRQLILSLARSGDTTAALAQYTVCQRVLAEGLGIDPMAETTALADRIRAARLKKRHHPLPVQPIPFVGRIEEIKILRQMIRQPEGRLVTLTGPGGIGKTRLALQVAADQAHAFLEGVNFISLSALTSVESLAPAILDALEIPLQGEVNPQAQLRDILRAQEMLLVLDGFENLLEGAGLLSELLETAPELRFLVTSRERLSLKWEIIYPLDGLEIPPSDEPEALEACSAARFFLQCVRRVRPDFTPSGKDHTAIWRLCQVTEGMPLALELASSWVSSLSLTAIAEAVQHGLDLLTTQLRDVTPHHRSLRAAIEKSYELLSQPAQEVFCRLAVFRGGFSPDAALQVAAASPEIIAALAFKSLLRSDPTGRCDFHEMLRQFAEDKLIPGSQQWAEIARQHSLYFGNFLRQRAERIIGGAMAETLSEIRLELENIRAAWRWVVSQSDWETISLSTQCLSRFYEFTGLLREGEAAFDQAVEKMRAQPPRSTPQTVQFLARLLIEQARFKRALSHNEAALQALAEALQIIESAQGPAIEAAAHLQWAEVLERQGEYPAAEDHYARALALAQAGGILALQAGSLTGLGIVAGERADVSGAMARFSEALQVSRAIGDLRGEHAALHNLAIAAMFQNDTPRARRYFEEELELMRDFGSPRWEVMTLLALAMLAAHQGDYTRLQHHCERALQICLDIGERREAGTALDGLGLAAISLGRFDDANLALGQALRSHAEIGNRQGESISRMYLSLVQRAVGEYNPAKTGLEAALATLRELKAQRDECLLLGHLSVTHHLLADHTAALQAAQNSLELAQQFGDRSFEADALAALGRALEGLGDLEQAAAAQQKSLGYRLEAGQEHLMHENMASLAFLALVQGNLAQAQEQTETILRTIAVRPIQGLEPFRVYLAVYRTLQKTKDHRAPMILNVAYRQMQAQAETIHQPAHRKSFFEQVQVNRVLLQLWKESPTTADN